MLVGAQMCHERADRIFNSVASISLTEYKPPLMAEKLALEKAVLSLVLMAMYNAAMTRSWNCTRSCRKYLVELLGLERNRSTSPIAIITFSLSNSRVSTTL